MDGFETFLDSYGLFAIFGLMLPKAAGVPIPIPGDVILLAAAARAAQGKIPLWLAFGVLLLALVLGRIIQFWLAKGPARRFIYRFGRYIGLTSTRLDSGAARLQKSGPVGIGLALLTPGLSSLASAACGIAGLTLPVFATGLILGTTLDLAIHFTAGYAGGALLAAIPLPLIIALVILGLGVWFFIRKRQRPGASTGELVGETYQAWSEATCPVCLAVGATNRLRPVLATKVIS